MVVIWLCSLYGYACNVASNCLANGVKVSYFRQGVDYIIMKYVFSCLCKKRLHKIDPFHFYFMFILLPFIIRA